MSSQTSTALAPEKVELSSAALPSFMPPQLSQSEPGLSSLSIIQRKRKEISPLRDPDGSSTAFLPKRQRHPTESVHTRNSLGADDLLQFSEHVTPANAAVPDMSDLSRASIGSELQPGQFEDIRANSGCVGTVSEDELIESITRILENICSINNDRISLPPQVPGKAKAPYRSTTYPDGSSSIFFSLQKPSVKMRYYVHRLVKYLHVSSSVFVVALIYLDRVHAADEILALTELNVHRLITTALALSCKFLEDEVHRNSTVCRIGGVPTTAEMNLLEAQFLRRINWDCSVSSESYELYKANVFKGHASRAVVAYNAVSNFTAAGVECQSTCSDSQEESEDGNE